MRRKPQRPILTLAVVQQRQGCQILRPRGAALVEQGGVADGNQCRADDAVGAQAFPASQPVTDCHVGATRVEIHQGATGGQAQIDRGVRDLEAAEARHQPRGGERGRGAEGQGLRPRERRHPLHRLGDLAKRAANLRQKDPARLGQFQRPVQATEQLRAEAMLEQGDLLAHRARCHPEVTGGLGHAGVPRHGLEGAQGIEGRQACHGVDIGFLNATRQGFWFASRP